MESPRLKKHMCTQLKLDGNKRVLLITQRRRVIRNLIRYIQRKHDTEFPIRLVVFVSLYCIQIIYWYIINMFIILTRRQVLTCDCFFILIFQRLRELCNLCSYKFYESKIEFKCFK